MIKPFKLTPVSATLLTIFTSNAVAYTIQPNEVVYNHNFSMTGDIILGSVIGGTNTPNSHAIISVYGNGHVSNIVIGEDANEGDTSSIVRIAENGVVADSNFNNSFIYVSDDARHIGSDPNRHSGGVLNNATLTSSNVLVFQSGETRGATLNSEARLYTFEGGVDNETIVNNGGRLYTLGGESNQTTIKTGGVHYIGAYPDGTLAEETSISSNANINGGIQYVEHGNAINTTINAGLQYIYTDGVANDTTITGGVQYVRGGVSDTAIVNGLSASISVQGGGIANNVTVEHGNAVVGASNGGSGDGSINGINLTGRDAFLLVMNGGTASNVLIDNGKQTVNGADATTDTVTIKGGSQVLVYGGTASHTYIEGGKQIVKANSKTESPRV
ncbi:hypothetical protein [Enterobacter asburiae]|uniref:hypothetical protein n=1 Tax=Enterobacter asburiae TaxID=61645 RepID=UPI003EE53B32